MSDLPPITHQRHSDPSAALARARNALRDAAGSVPSAASALKCSANFLRQWMRSDPSVADGIALRKRGWSKGRKRRAAGGDNNSTP